MTETNNGIDLGTLIIVILLLSIWVGSWLLSISDAANSAVSNFTNFIKFAFTSFTIGTYLLYFIIISYFVSIYFVLRSRRKTKRLKREAEEREQNRRSPLDKLLDKDISKMNREELTKFREDLNNAQGSYRISYTYEDKYEKQKKVREREIELYNSPEEREERQKRLLEIEAEEREERQQNQKKYEQERKEAEVLENLETDENYVYKKDDLSNRQIEALKKEGYKFANEYCVFEKKRINVMIRPPSNHLVQHTFLVWSITKLLEQNKKIKWVEQHLSVNADITFNYDKEEYAIEVETGSLLRKSEQRKEKVGFLNRKFPNRWLFVVSNKELASEYAKFGPTAIRNTMAKKLEKLLKKA